MIIRTLVMVGLFALAASDAVAADATADKQPPPTTDVQGGGSLSDKLSTTNGVIHPTENADPGIAKTPPVSGSATPMPVIPPPGTPGGNSNVKPK